MTASAVLVMASETWADRIAQLLHDAGIVVPVAAVGAPHGPQRRCRACGQVVERGAA